MAAYQPFYNKSYALVLGIDTYRFMQPLRAAVRGAADLAQILRNDYDFAVTLLTNEEVTRDAVFRWLDTISQQAGPDDRIIVYFAGHGVTREIGHHERGYLALADSRPDEWRTMLAMDDITEEMEFIKAKHTLYILDCCFSGLALDGRSIASVTREVQHYLTRPVRYAITAGGKEVVDDAAGPGMEYSLFTHYLIEWLTTAHAQPPGGVWRARELGNYLERMVARSRRGGHKPNHNYLPGSGDGDFLFRWENAPQLPYDIEMALRSGNSHVRWGAVSALAALTENSDLDLARAAEERLAALRHHDPSEQVRATARAVLEGRSTTNDTRPTMPRPVGREHTAKTIPSRPTELIERIELRREEKSHENSPLKTLLQNFGLL